MTVPASGPGLMSTTALAASSLAKTVRAADRYSRRTRPGLEGP